MTKTVPRLFAGTSTTERALASVSTKDRAMIVVVPPATAVTTPLSSTVATAGFALDHLTRLFEGRGSAMTVAIKVCFSPTGSVIVDGATVTVVSVGGRFGGDASRSPHPTRPIARTRFAAFLVRVIV